MFVHFAVFQEWPEEDYPPYANGPGYIISSDIAEFIISEFEKHKLRVRLNLLNLLFLALVVCVFYVRLNENHTVDGAVVQDGRREHGNVGGAI